MGTVQSVGTSVSTLLNRCAVAVEDTLSIRDCISADASGNIQVYDSLLCLLLEKMQERLNGVECVCVFRGSSDIYTAAGKIPYMEYEENHKREYDMNRSKFYSGLHSTVQERVRGVELKGSGGGGAVVLMEPCSMKPSYNTDMIFAFWLDSEQLTESLSTYMGNWSGPFFIYNLRKVECVLDQENSEVSYADILRVPGTGVQHFSLNSQKYVLLRYINDEIGLVYTVAEPEDIFYASLSVYKKSYLSIVGWLSGALLVCAIVLTAFLYNPILYLYKNVTNREKASIQENELNTIMASYQETRREREDLESRVSILGDTLRNQFLNKLLFGKAGSREKILQGCSYVNLEWKFQMFSVIFMFTPLEKNPEWPLKRDNTFQTDVMLIPCEIWQENALCWIVNLNEEEALERLRSIAEELKQEISVHGMEGIQVGIGRVYPDITKLTDSFMEASVAARLADALTSGVYSYDDRAEQVRGGNLHDALQTGLFLLREAISHSEAAVAKRAISEIADTISGYSDSFLMFRFYAAQVVTVLQGQSIRMGEPISDSELEKILRFQSKTEFLEGTGLTVEHLCETMDKQSQENDLVFRNRLLAYIRENFTRFDFTLIQLTEHFHISASHATAILQETVGLSFAKYVAALRMEEFKRLLCFSNSTVGDCVKAVGYTDVPSFLRKFKAQEGMTPTQYRQKWENNSNN